MNEGYQQFSRLKLVKYGKAMSNGPEKKKLIKFWIGGIRKSLMRTQVNKKN